MLFQTHLPSEPLHHFVERIFYYEGLTPTHSLDRFLPNGNTEYIIDLSDEPQYIHDNETLTEIQTCRQAWVSGVRTRPITIPSGRNSRMLIVAFKKGRAYPFFPLPMSEITDLVADADLVYGRSVCDLREQLLGAPSIHQRFCLVERFLFRQVSRSFTWDDTVRCVEYAVSGMLSRPDQLSLQDLSEQIGYSQKHFIHLFKEQVGVSPKQYLKLMRFQHALMNIEKASFMPWSEIALQNGYYDQAHFIHEFKNFSGFTPVEYLARKNGTLNYIPVA